MSRRKIFIPFGQDSFTRAELTKHLQQERTLGIEEGEKASWVEFRKKAESRRHKYDEIMKQDIKEICAEVKKNSLKINEKNYKLSQYKKKDGELARDKETGIKILHEKNKELLAALYDKCYSPDETDSLDAVLKMFEISGRNTNKPKS